MLSKDKKDDKGNACNCQVLIREKCPLRGECNKKYVVCKATTPTPDPHFYISVTKDFKPTWLVHKQTFKNKDNKKATGLSAFVWERAYD